MNRTLLDCVRFMLRTSSVDKTVWAEALTTSVYIRNRVVSRSLPHIITPYRFWIGVKPNISHLRVFRHKYWFVTPKSKLKKLDYRSKEELMTGYTTQSEGYKIWDVESSKLVVSGDVVFNKSSVDSLGIYI